MFGRSCESESTIHASFTTMMMIDGVNAFYDDEADYNCYGEDGDD